MLDECREKSTIYKATVSLSINQKNIPFDFVKRNLNFLPVIIIINHVKFSTNVTTQNTDRALVKNSKRRKTLGYEIEYSKKKASLYICGKKNFILLILKLNGHWISNKRNEVFKCRNKA